ncbi:MAG: hypothetical protein ACJZ62_05380 [Candidatus Pelagibacterales bacterium]
MLIKFIWKNSRTIIAFLFLSILYQFQSLADQYKEIEIDNPKFSEKGLDKRLFEIKAEKGIQKENYLELFIVEGKLRTDSGIWIYLNAEKGNYNQVENLIELSGNITFYTDDDDQFKSDYALFSTNNDLIEFKENIKHLKGKNMITANQSKIKNDFNYIIYEGNVSTTLFIE